MAVCVVDRQSDDVVESVSVKDAEYVTDDVAELDAIEFVADRVADGDSEFVAELHELADGLGLKDVLCVDEMHDEYVTVRHAEFDCERDDVKDPDEVTSGVMVTERVVENVFVTDVVYDADSVGDTDAERQSELDALLDVSAEGDGEPVCVWLTVGDSEFDTEFVRDTDEHADFVVDADVHRVSVGVMETVDVAEKHADMERD